MGVRRRIKENSDMLVHIGMADACASAYEYVKHRGNEDFFHQIVQFERFLRHPTHGHAPGNYTDDTEMSIANARALIWYANNRSAREDELRNKFIECYLSEFLMKRRKGYSGDFQGFLDSFHDASQASVNEFWDRIKDRNRSTKNGACMRAAVCGVINDPFEVVRIANLQARITHDSPEGRFSAIVVALLAHQALYGEGTFREFFVRYHVYIPAELRKFHYIFSEDWDLSVPVKSYHGRGISVAIATVHAAYTILRSGGTAMEMLRTVLAVGGDTDSVAAVVWGIASPGFIPEEIAPFMWGIEDCTRLQNIGKELMGVSL